jgi:hypothetical protein
MTAAIDDATLREWVREAEARLARRPLTARQRALLPGGKASDDAASGFAGAVNSLDAAIRRLLEAGEEALAFEVREAAENVLRAIQALGDARPPGPGEVRPQAKALRIRRGLERFEDELVATKVVTATVEALMKARRLARLREASERPSDLLAALDALAREAKRPPKPPLLERLDAIPVRRPPR